MTCAGLNPVPEAAGFRRSPDQVMRLARLGSSHPTRLSFLRQLLRRMKDENWRFDRPVWEIDAKGVGRAVYRAPSARCAPIPLWPLHMICHPKRARTG